MITLGNPKLAKNSNNVLATLVAVMDLNGMAAGKHVALSIMTRMNLFPDLVGGNGP